VRVHPGICWVGDTRESAESDGLRRDRPTPEALRMSPFDGARRSGGDAEQMGALAAHLRPLFGGRGRHRSVDLALFRRALYQLSYPTLSFQVKQHFK
jgi:hypothetical protein